MDHPPPYLVTIMKPTLKNLLLPAAALVSCLLTPAQAAIFVKYDGIDGESKDSNHDRWIDVLSIDWAMKRQRRLGSRRRLEDCFVNTMKVTYKQGNTPPILKTAYEVGKPSAFVTASVRETDSNGQESYLKYELKNVMVTSYQTSASPSGGPTVTDVVMNFDPTEVC